MKRRPLPLACGFVALLTATGCGLLGPLQTMTVEPGFTPTTFGFEVDEDGVEVASHTVVFESSAGSLGGLVTGYEVLYLDNAGDPLTIEDSVLRSRGSLAHPIPPGLVCEESVPCTAAAPDSRFERQASEPLENFVNLSADAAMALVNTTAGRGRAEVTFYLTDTNGVERSLTREVGITYPVAP